MRFKELFQHLPIQYIRQRQSFGFEGRVTVPASAKDIIDCADRIVFGQVDWLTADFHFFNPSLRAARNRLEPSQRVNSDASLCRRIVREG